MFQKFTRADSFRVLTPEERAKLAEVAKTSSKKPTLDALKPKP